MNDNVKLTLNDIYLFDIYLKPTTVLFLYIELEQCVETFYELSQCMHELIRNSNILYHF